MLRVMTWNIRTGGRDGDGADRRDEIVELIDAQRPDVLLLQELRGFDDRMLAGFAARLGLRPYRSASCLGQPVAVLVRPPLRTLAAAPLRRPFHHAAGRVVLATDAGPLTVLGAHLAPYSGGWRRVEVDWLVRAVRRAPGELTVVGGDLNALDPATDHTAQLSRLQPKYRRRHLRRDGRTVDTRAVGVLLDAGLVDLQRCVGGPDGGHTVPTWHGGAEFVGMRLDYLLGSPALAARARDVRVVRGGTADRASDHYPLLADLALDPA
ncbi:endonuclease/exonuclease/phosphatase family protein [Micromonospora sp. 15K316]|uniref:endonuclease/exonuclease/phosphatase family protein n=1 Tax=Micromonospora sp. 15K316 TaxID=2530376 RepID=UPI0010470C95|nr:endonuclease/exonuclease/phosphatase family protein [Micromonospora sp. 15K316]TDC39284.1 endonuclease/exonuclease/phosphatase family protein [Micromonospora sp. 15K316]